MYTTKEIVEDGDTYWLIYNEQGRSIAELWDGAVAAFIVTKLNQGIRMTTMQAILGPLSPVEPGDRSRYQEDIELLINACKQSQEVVTTRENRRLLMSFLAARLNAYRHELGFGANDAVSGIRILTSISHNLRPGIVNGIAKVHTPALELWSLDAQDYWQKLSAIDKEA